MQRCRGGAEVVQRCRCKCRCTRCRCRGGAEVVQREYRGGAEVVLVQERWWILLGGAEVVDSRWCRGGGF